VTRRSIKKPASSATRYERARSPGTGCVELRRR